MAKNSNGRQDEGQKEQHEQIPPALLIDNSLNEPELVYYMLIVKLSHSKGYCFMRNEELGKLRNKGVRTIQRIVESLKNKGYVDIQFVDYTNSKGKRYMQRQLIPLRYVKAGTNDATKLSWGDKNVMGGTTKMSPIPLTKMSPINHINKETSICANDDLRKSAHSHSTSKTKKEETDKEGLFSQFWAAYPKKKDKARAHDKFIRIKNLPAVFPKIMQALAQQKKSRQWQDMQFVPYAKTWINGERWNDEPDEKPPVPSSSSGVRRPTVGNETEAQRRARAAAGLQELKELHALNETERQ